MDISQIQVKITNINTATNTLSVVWACDQSQLPIDEYPVCRLPLDDFLYNNTSTSAILEQLAILGIPECQEPCRVASMSYDTLLAELTQQVGVITEFDVATLPVPPLQMMSPMDGPLAAPPQE